ncbi:unnamed protein product, partial [Arabidopsis halleri]
RNETVKEGRRIGLICRGSQIPFCCVLLLQFLYFSLISSSHFQKH